MSCFDLEEAAEGRELGLLLLGAAVGFGATAQAVLYHCDSFIARADHLDHVAQAGWCFAAKDTNGFLDQGVMFNGKEEGGNDNGRLKRKEYEKEMGRLHAELCKLQDWVKYKGLRVIVIFEGRDAAGKGGTIRAITERVSPRVFRVVALPAPSDREKSQAYVQRYVQHFPAGGEIVIFDRSWYNRAGVEHVMGFCTPEQYSRFLEHCSAIEKYFVDTGIILIKYWMEVGKKEQQRRFEARIKDPLRVPGELVRCQRSTQCHIVTPKQNNNSPPTGNSTCFADLSSLDSSNGGADGIVARSLKKTGEKPLNSSVYCHLLIFPMSLRNPMRFFGHPYNAPLWQQLATVDNGLSEVASRRAISHTPFERGRAGGFVQVPFWEVARRGRCGDSSHFCRN